MGKYTYYILDSEGNLEELAGQREVFAAIKADDFDEKSRIFRGIEMSFEVEERTIKTPTLSKMD